MTNLEAPVVPETTDILGIGPVLDQELNRLPRKYRVPLILCYLQGHTHDQAAEELECPVGTVRSRLARGRDLLRRRLTSRGHAPTAAILGGGSGLAGETLHRSRPAVSDFSNGQGGLRARCIQNHSGRRGQRVGPGPDPRSAYDHETRSTEVGRNWRSWRPAYRPAVSLPLLMPRNQGPNGALDANGVTLTAFGPQEKPDPPQVKVEVSSESSSDAATQGA